MEGGGRRGKRGSGRGRKEGVNESVYAVCVRYKINVQVMYIRFMKIPDIINREW